MLEEQPKRILNEFVFVMFDITYMNIETRSSEKQIASFPWISHGLHRKQKNEVGNTHTNKLSVKDCE
jgi:hypothetical protein